MEAIRSSVPGVNESIFGQALSPTVKDTEAKLYGGVVDIKMKACARRCVSAARSRGADCGQ